ncbi:acyltransferase [Actinopolymorpha alba]|uniref:acyltransferase n=1 Tax=Actinopolymorpha alba TaxID=533267 RepID=UPI0003A013AD|nr:acyltransferase family protein [Actinopolymorpha alba]
MTPAAPEPLAAQALKAHPSETHPSQSPSHTQPRETRPTATRRTPGDVPWISWARIVAIVGVVAIHVCSHLILEWGEISAKLWHFGNLLESASRFSVPVFVMVSGATLLAPRPGETLRDFYLRRASRIAIPLVVWTCFFLVLDAWSHGREVTAYTFVQGFLWGRPYYHLYFLYVVAGLYLITPFLRVFVANADRRLLVAASAICIGLASADKVQHTFMGGGGFNAFTYFIPFIGYYLAGYVVATTRLPAPRKVVALWSAGIFVAAVLVTHMGTWWLMAQTGVQRGRLLYEYYSPPTIAAALAMTLLLRAVFGDRAGAGIWLAAWNPASTSFARRARPHRQGRVDAPGVRRVADLTLGVFLLHPIPLELLVRRNQPVFSSAYVDMAFHVGVIVALLVGCALVTLVVRQIPLLRRLV